MTCSLEAGQWLFRGSSASKPWLLPLVLDDELERLDPEVAGPGRLVSEHVFQFLLPRRRAR